MRVCESVLVCVCMRVCLSTVVGGYDMTKTPLIQFLKYGNNVNIQVRG